MCIVGLRMVSRRWIFLMQCSSIQRWFGRHSSMQLSRWMPRVQRAATDLTQKSLQSPTGVIFFKTQRVNIALHSFVQVIKFVLGYVKHICEIFLVAIWEYQLLLLGVIVMSFDSDDTCSKNRNWLFRNVAYEYDKLLLVWHRIALYNVETTFVIKHGTKIRIIANRNLLFRHKPMANVLIFFFVKWNSAS